MQRFLILCILYINKKNTWFRFDQVIRIKEASTQTHFTQLIKVYKLILIDLYWYLLLSNYIFIYKIERSTVFIRCRPSILIDINIILYLEIYNLSIILAVFFEQRIYGFLLSLMEYSIQLLFLHIYTLKHTLRKELYILPRIH